MAASLDLTVANLGSALTYRRANAESVIDVTFCRIRPPSVLRGWKVLSDLESASDHFYIEFSLERNLPVAEEFPERSTGWSYRRLDTVALANHLAISSTPLTDDTTPADEAADHLVEYLSAACDSFMPSRAPPPTGSRQAHWWNQEIQYLRDDFGKLQRQYQRSRRRHDAPELIEMLIAAFKSMRKAIRASQAKSWSTLC